MSNKRCFSFYFARKDEVFWQEERSSVILHNLANPHCYWVGNFVFLLARKSVQKSRGKHFWVSKKEESVRQIAQKQTLARIGELPEDLDGRKTIKNSPKNSFLVFDKLFLL